MQRVGGARRKTRHKLKKSRKLRGKVDIQEYLKDLKVGDAVSITAEPAVQKGMPCMKFKGIAGKVIGKQGSCYRILIKDKGKEKLLVSHPIHLKLLK